MDPLPEVVTSLLSSFITPATNYISVYQRHLGVKDSWTIDTALQPPPALLTRPWRGGRKNLDVHSRHGAVDVKVQLVRTLENHQHRATLQVGSRHGTVQVYIVRRSMILPFYTFDQYVLCMLLVTSLTSAFPSQGFLEARESLGVYPQRLPWASRAQWQNCIFRGGP